MTWVIAHRGASRDCPENTRAAFDEALRQGCDGIELDLQLSRDGRPMVYHDRTLARAGGGRRRLSRLTAKELRELDPGARVEARFRGQPMPTLTEVLRRYGRRTRLLLELKVRGSARSAEHHALARATCAEVNRFDLGAEVLLLCFDFGVLEECRRVAPGIPRVLNLKAPRRPTAALREQLRRLSALSVDIRTLTPGFAAAVRRPGLPLVTYTCNTRGTVVAALRAGVQGVMADRPGWLAATIDAAVAAGTGAGKAG